MCIRDSTWGAQITDRLQTVANLSYGFYATLGAMSADPHSNSATLATFKNDFGVLVGDRRACQVQVADKLRMIS